MYPSRLAFLAGYLRKTAGDAQPELDWQEYRHPAYPEGINPRKYLKKHVYGDKVDTEFAKADQYNKDRGSPIRMGETHRETLPVLNIGNWSSGSGPIKSVVESPIPDDTPRAVKFLMRNKYINISPYDDQEELRKAVRKFPLNHPYWDYKRNLSGMSLEDEIDLMEDPNYEDIILRHELAHTGSAAPGKRYLDNHEYLPRAQERGARKPPMLGYGDTATYPEEHAAEIIPPLSALQQHLFQTTGKRIESPEEYRLYMQQYDALPDADRKTYRDKLPMEVRRLLNYRETMREHQQRWPERLEIYDSRNAEEIPGIVRKTPPASLPGLRDGYMSRSPRVTG